MNAIHLRWQSLARTVSALVLGCTAACAPVAGTVNPTEGTTNEAHVTLSVLGSRDTDTSFLQPTSYIDFRYTPEINLLEFTGFELRGSDVHFDLGGVFALDARNIQIGDLDADSSAAGSVDPTTGTVRLLLATEAFSNVYVNGSYAGRGVGIGPISLEGHFDYDSESESVRLTDLAGALGPYALNVGGFIVTISGDVIFNFEGAALPVPG